MKIHILWNLLHTSTWQVTLIVTIFSTEQELKELLFSVYVELHKLCSQGHVYCKRKLLRLARLAICWGPQNNMDLSTLTFELDMEQKPKK